MTIANTLIARRAFLSGVSLAPLTVSAFGARPAAPLNLALVATVASSAPSSKAERIALNSGTPSNANDSSHDALPFWEPEGTSWVEYAWVKPVTLHRIEVYWNVAGNWLFLPKRYRVLAWNGTAFKPVAQPRGLGLAKDRFNATTFRPVTTTRLRLEIEPDGEKSFALLQWRALGTAVNLPPVVDAGPDRIVVVDGTIFLNGAARWVQDKPTNVVLWDKRSGPGDVDIVYPPSRRTTATAFVPGDYVFTLTARGDSGTAGAATRVRVVPPPPEERLDVVYTTGYALSSPFWKARAKALIVNWIPHCIAQCERTDLMVGEGGIDNFLEAAKALRGEPHGKHKGYVFSNAWVHQTVESMCLALMVDAAGDGEILAAQAKMRATLERWIPIILAAQHPDGYLQTAYTLADRSEWPERWSPDHRGNHEGYVSGYFIESAINHCTLTGGRDLRLYNAAKQLADCWVANIATAARPWFDGHQEMEQALVRFGRFVNDREGAGKGSRYIALAELLLESRQGGSQYDQSHLPAREQAEAVGHAVRAMYFYSGMADIAAETGDRGFQGAVASLADNLVNRKYYVTGGVGSGDTSEGFGDDYALRNDAYCESCSSCGLIFFDYKLNLAYHDARYADLYEETLYNALLGAVDLDGKAYTYTNPLQDRSPRYHWHSCPCCVGNIPRTLLMLPTWSYVKSADGLYVNLFVGSKANVGAVAGTQVEMVQETDYPWDRKVAITVNPAAPCQFTLHIRVPNRATSALYTPVPAVAGLENLRLNGQPVANAEIENGYLKINRQWQAGDRIEFELPLPVEIVKPDARIAATAGRIALRRGPLVYNVEAADQPRIDGAISNAPLAAVWRPDLLGGIMAIAGTWADGSPLTAIPNYARMNRAGPPTEYPPHHAHGPILSQVWIKA